MLVDSIPVDFISRHYAPPKNLLQIPMKTSHTKTFWIAILFRLLYNYGVNDESSCAFLLVLEENRVPRNWTPSMWLTIDGFVERTRHRLLDTTRCRKAHKTLWAEKTEWKPRSKKLPIGDSLRQQACRNRHVLQEHLSDFKRNTLSSHRDKIGFSSQRML